MYTDSGHISPKAGEVKITRADGTVIYKKPYLTRKEIKKLKGSRKRKNGEG